MVENIDNLISRQGAIEVVQNRHMMLSKEKVLLINDLENLPSAEPHWIPVTERLPEKENKSYWVCTNTGYQCQCRWTDNIYGLGSIGDRWGWSIFDVPKYSYVVAWRELTESFKGVDE